MATVSEMHSSERNLTDHEFEELLQRTWELVQTQKPVQPPFETSAESPSWT